MFDYFQDSGRNAEYSEFRDHKTIVLSTQEFQNVTQIVQSLMAFK